jgi:alpha-amylase/alpha-mannosidase (GH57 family)
MQAATGRRASAAPALTFRVTVTPAGQPAPAVWWPGGRSDRVRSPRAVWHALCSQWPRGSANTGSREGR